MVFDIEVGGGGGNSSLIDQLEPIFTEIADLLGELAGNEAAWTVLDGQETMPLNDGWTREPGHFTIPGTYGFDTPALYVAMHPSHPDFSTSSVTNADREQLVQQAVTDVWNETHDSWSSGTLNTLYRTASRNVWEPDPAAVSASADTLGDVTRWLDRQLRPGAGWAAPGDANAPEWLSRLRQHWPATSASSDSFYDFWNDVNDKCSLYLHAAARLASTSAQVAATLSDFQTNLHEATTKTRDRVKEALQQWQAWKDSSGAWPSGAMSDNSGAQTILGGASYVAGVVSLFPPAAAIAGPISVVTGGLSYLVPDQSVVMEAIQAATAQEIHSGFMNDLATIDTTMTSVLDGIHTEAPQDGSTTGSQGFQSYASTVVGNRRDWSPPPVNL